MRKYEVEVSQRYTAVQWEWVTVEAESEEEARRLALELVEDEGFQDSNDEGLDYEDLLTEGCTKYGLDGRNLGRQN